MKARHKDATQRRDTKAGGRRPPVVRPVFCTVPPAATAQTLPTQARPRTPPANVYNGKSVNLWKNKGAGADATDSGRSDQPGG